MTFRNEGLVDRLLRISAGVVLLFIAWQSWPGTNAMLLAALGAIATMTGLIGWCPAYSLFGASTCRRKS